MTTSNGMRALFVATLLLASVAVVVFSAWWVVPRWLEDQERADFQSKLVLHEARSPKYDLIWKEFLPTGD